MLLDGRWADTMPTASFQLIKIERVENRALWDEYAMQRQLMQKRRRQPWESFHEWAWHGTRGTDPQLIANGGVDFREAKAGLWGR